MTTRGVGILIIQLGTPDAPTAEALLYGLVQLQNKIRRSQTVAR